MVEDVSVCCVRATVYVQYERVFFVRVEVWRLLHPSLYAATVETLVPNFFRLCEIKMREKLVVYVGQLSGFCAGTLQPEQVVDARRRRAREDKPRRAGRCAQ